MSTPQSISLAASPALTAAPARRSLALDALRGWAILTMVLSGMVPDALPTWMHHAQVIHGKYNPAVPGITWVDLVFPFFLFAMGAAIPFALRRRIERGMTNLQAVATAFKRGFLLIIFAIFQHHVGPWSLQAKTGPGALPMILALAGFAVMFLVLVRMPDRIPTPLAWALRAVGWLGGALIVWGVYGKFDSENNIILWLLAQMAVFGSLAWLATRNSLTARLGILGFLMAIRLASNETGWVNWLSANTSIPGIFSMGPWGLLFIVIPGTIAGDLIQKWMRSSGRDEPASAVNAWSPTRLWIIALAMLGLNAAVLVGLAPAGVPDPALGILARWAPIATPIIIALTLAAGMLLAKPSSEAEKLLRTLFVWGTYWLVLGLLFEPYEGGIKKDSATMSYYFVTAGLALFMLISFMIIIDILGHRRWFAGLLVDNGQNPMIAYVGFAHLMFPIMVLVGAPALLDKMFDGPALGMTRAILQTLLLAVIVSGFTRAKIFWRS
ncbi:DUF5009 domain-containing protein [candidate division BRC1 bacterium HGW-BRC1-1]|jgi:predicted acyltransferase|nr:MAG: DUF5009 domain-containing protein [candidate division BRC1 bacterium HGW-BRC1-1]